MIGLMCAATDLPEMNAASRDGFFREDFVYFSPFGNGGELIANRV